ncbi:MAG: hypothetical protein IJ041_00880 [Clostridia bacterium]|nr:hypothetical protein [Clostridia bacterium]
MEDVNRIIRALAGETSAQHVTRGWPLEEAAALVPLIVIRLASESCTARYDDQAYLMETEYELRVFARDPAQADTVAEEARLCMQAQGYQRVFTAEETTAAMHQRVCRFRKCWETERMDER